MREILILATETPGAALRSKLRKRILKLKGLHEGNIAGYRWRLSRFRDWQARPR
jgi:hypothetical protein